MQDNAPAHKSRRTLSWFNRQPFAYISDWPAQSPDLNPIENVWAWMTRELANTSYADFDRLISEVQATWDMFSRADCAKYVDSFRRRCEAVIAKNGDWTKY